MSSIDPSGLFDELLDEAEERFGPRSRTLRVTVMARDHPTPETLPVGLDGCIVYFAKVAATNYMRLRFQLSHEAIHVLSGALRRDAVKLEEGLAVWFSLNNSKTNRKSKKTDEASLEPLFQDALQLFRQMSPSDERIKNLRSLQRDLDLVTKQQLVDIFLITDELAQKLLLRVPLEMDARSAGAGHAKSLK